MKKTNFKDIGFKVLWTGVAAALGVVGTELADLPAAWTPVAIAGVNFALAWVRQQLGEVPS